MATSTKRLQGLKLERLQSKIEEVIQEVFAVEDPASVEIVMHLAGAKSVIRRRLGELDGKSTS